MHLSSGGVGKVMIPSVLPDCRMGKILLKGACQLNKVLDIVPDQQVRFEVGGAEVMWWPVPLGGEVHSDVLAPVTVTEVVTDKMCNLSWNCIVPCIIMPLFEDHRTCIEDMTRGLQLPTQ